MGGMIAIGWVGVGISLSQDLVGDWICYDDDDGTSPSSIRIIEEI